MLRSNGLFTYITIYYHKQQFSMFNIYYLCTLIKFDLKTFDLPPPVMSDISALVHISQLGQIQSNLLSTEPGRNKERSSL